MQAIWTLSTINETTTTNGLAYYLATRPLTTPNWYSDFAALVGGFTYGKKG